MFGIDWNMDGEVDIIDDFLTFKLLEESEKENDKEDENKNQSNKIPYI